MQPYQEANQEIARQGERPLKALGGIASVGLSAGAAGLGGMALGKVMPFLNKYIPQDIAIKGLSKVDPRFGKFINKAMEAGKSFDEVKEFIQEKISSSERDKEDSQQNIISKHSPNLFAFLQQEIGKGRSAEEAAALARLPANGFAKDIDTIEKNAKSRWSDIISSIFGGEGQQMAQGGQEMGQPGQQPGQGQEKLMAILQKLQQMRG